MIFQASPFYEKMELIFLSHLQGKPPGADCSSCEVWYKDIRAGSSVDKDLSLGKSCFIPWDWQWHSREKLGVLGVFGQERVVPYLGGDSPGFRAHSKNCLYILFYDYLI